jgi:formylglycine-generating enzyme required for sulfatase activity
VEKPGESAATAPNAQPETKVPFSIFQDRLQDGALGPEMILIPPGEFRMGDLQGIGCKDEQPAHRVRIPRAFAIGRYTLTFAEYDRFALAAKRKLPDDVGWGRGQHPVIHVSWHDAQAYCAWLSLQTQQSYRLPSEAEWEYAARAGTETAYWWGNEFDAGKANGAGAIGKTTLAGHYPANPWGLLDTAGNVWEWVQDVWHEGYQGAPEDGEAWLADGDPALRGIRGGSGFNIPLNLRAANRFRFHPDVANYILGFRLARDVSL